MRFWPNPNEVERVRKNDVRSQLSTWLREGGYEDDVIMPVAVGKKHPMFAHKGGAWSWARFDAFDWRSGTFDACLLLSAVCVVDVDSVAQADALEARFEVLKRVPCARTAKGKHYWFRRPDAADRLGYYDGPAQRERGVDFKSLCRTGTSGVIMIPPSTGKAWERAPWGVVGGLVDIPQELLDAVAAPRPLLTRSLSLRFCGPDGEPCHRRFYAAEREQGGAAWLYRMSYLEPFLPCHDDGCENDREGENAGCALGNADGVPMPPPCDVNAFDALLHLLEHRALPKDFAPTSAAILSLQVAADVVGLQPPHLLERRLGALRAKTAVDLYDLSPAWWQAWEEGSIGTCRRVDAALARALRHNPLADDPAAPRRMFPGLKAASDAAGIIRGELVLVESPGRAVQDALPHALLAVLKRHRAHLVLAGGAVLGMVMRGVEPGADMDMFVHGCSAEMADEILRDVAHASRGVICSSRNAVTFAFEHDAVVQVVLRLHEDAHQVLRSFDIAPCMVLARVSEMEEEGEGATVVVVEATVAWVESARARAFWIDFTRWSSTSVQRVLKYVAKGFDAFAVGIPAHPDMRTSFDTSCVGGADATGLFTVERAVMEARSAGLCAFSKGRAGPTDRLAMSEVHGYASRYCGGRTSGYGTRLKLQGRLIHVMRAVFGLVGINRTRRSAALNNREWTTEELARPTDPRIVRLRATRS